MRSISLVEDYIQSDVRPNELIKQYIALMEKDIARYFLPNLTHDRHCPACGGVNLTPVFERLGMIYNQCRDCASLFVGPRPTADALKEFGSKSEALKFWSEKLSPSTFDERSKRIIQPRMDWIAQDVAEHNPNAETLVMLGHHPGYGEALQALDLFDSCSLVRLDRFDGHSEKSFSAVYDGLDQLDNQSGDVILAFESLDAVLSPKDSLNHLHRSLRNGGLLYITSILGSGFDIQTLKSNHRNILPADRMNLLSVEGWQSLLSNAGFEIIEFSTPGVFDTQIVCEALDQGNIGLENPFLNYMFTRRSKDDIRAFQNFLQKSLLSSFGRILARKV